MAGSRHAGEQTGAAAQPIRPSSWVILAQRLGAAERFSGVFPARFRAPLLLALRLDICADRVDAVDKQGRAGAFLLRRLLDLLSLSDGNRAARYLFL